MTRPSFTSLLRRLSLTSARWLRLLVIVCAAILSWSVDYSGWSAYQAAERFLHDQRIKMSPKITTERRIIIADIDEQSLAEIGAWPWNRATLGQLIQRLDGEYHAAIIGLDIVFPDPRPEDTQLKSMFAQSPVVLAQVFDADDKSVNHFGRLGDSVALPPAFPAGIAYGYIANHAQLQPPGVAIGHITPTLDSDGVVRRLQAVWCYQQTCSPTLGLRIFMHLTGANALINVAHPWQGNTLELSPDAGIHIPLAEDGSIVLPYRLGPDAFTVVSAADLLQGKADPELLANSIVLIGSTALGVGDRITTPQGSLMPGITIHAELLAGLLDNFYITHPPYASLIWLLVTALWGGVLLLLRDNQLHPWKVLLWSTSGGIIWGIANLLLWHHYGLELPLTPVWIFLLLSFTLIVPVENLRTLKQLGGLVTQVSSYIPASVVRRLLDTPARQSATPETDQRLVTVLFADLRGFTTFAEQSSPEKVALLVQKMLSELSAIVAAHGGIIEKFTGDGLMAIWGAPDPDPYHAQHALDAAVDMQARIQALQPWFAEHDFPKMRLGVGINTGEAVVGIYGNRDHRSYSAHGDAVNVGERIQRLTKETGIPVLFGATTADQLSARQSVAVGSYPVAGRQQYVTVHCRPEDYHYFQPKT